MVKIESVTIDEGKSGGNDIVIKLQDFQPETRVHCIATQFIGPVHQQLHYGMKTILKEKFFKTVFPFALWKNIYLSNRELGDEFRYVFDRKYAERFVGSSLDRPKLILRRNFV
jgi:hypothetical protein